ncbi:MAG: helix-turn-helix domain-containing protein [Microcoleaceae cyanobacterium]
MLTQRFEYFSLWNFGIQSVNLHFYMQLSKLDQILGLEIQRRRIEKGWSQEYLAEVTGLHRTYISQLERGLKSPSVRVLSHITNALDITMGEFLRAVEELLSAEGK